MAVATIASDSAKEIKEAGAVAETTIASEVSESGEVRTKTLKTVPVDILKSDHRWQRFVSKRAEDMGENWSYTLANVIVVSERKNGDLVVIDGQHRAAGARIAGIKELIAEVHQGLTPKDEARIYDELNTSRKTITALDRFRARVFYGDPVALTIKKMVEERGGNIRTSLHTQGEGHIAAVWALERLHQRGGEDLLTWVLDTLKDSFEVLDNNSVSIWNVAGLRMFYDKQQGKFDQEYLIKVLRREGNDNLRRMMHAHRQIWGGGGAQNGYRAILEAYNRQMPAKNKLTP